MGFWSGAKLFERAKAEGLVDPFDDKAIDCAAYTLSLGDFAFSTGDDKDRAASAKIGETPGVRKLGDKEMFTIRPGQFAFLLTKEVVTIPSDAIGFISVKARRKLEGLINVSGFHVDPGWSSRLIFGVFNAGPQDLVLQRGEPLFLLFFADLSFASSEWKGPKDETYVYQKKQKYQDIPPDIIQKMSGPIPSLYKVDKSTKELEQRISELGSRATLATGTAGLALIISLAIFGKALFTQSQPPPSSDPRSTIVIAQPSGADGVRPPAQTAGSSTGPSNSGPVASDAQNALKQPQQKTGKPR